MNTTFNFNRFWKVMCNEWSLTWKKVLVFWVFLAMFPLGYLTGFAVNDSPSSLIDRNNFLIYPFLIACLLQGFYLQFYFREFSSKKKTQALLVLPASQNETFWAKFLLGVILYLLIGFFLISTFLILGGLLNERAWTNGLSELHTEDYFLSTQGLIFLANGIWSILGFISGWLVIAAGFLFGLLIFKKNAILQTFAFWTAVIIVLGFFICSVYFLFTGTFPLFATLGVIWFSSSNAIPVFHLYPKLEFIFYGFIGLALIAICRVKYNEKTI